VFGFLFGVWQVVLADMQVALSLSSAALGVALTVGTLASLPAMLVGGRIADHWGVKSVILWPAITLGIAFVGFFLVDGYAMLIVALVVFFGASGVFDIGINTAAVRFEQIQPRHVLTYFHAAFSGMAAVGALTAGLLLIAGFPFRGLYVLVALVLGGFGIVLWRSQTLPSQPRATIGGIRKTSLYREPAVLLLAVIAALSMFCEGTLESWSAIYLRSYMDLPAVLGAAGIAVFHTAMLLGRLGSAAAAGRYSPKVFLLGAGALIAGGMLLALVSVSPTLILGGLLIVGLSLAVVFPMVISMAGHNTPERAGEATSVITVIGYGGFLMGPALIGGLTQWLDLRAALGTVIVSGVLITVLSVWTRMPTTRR
jgi:MFS family permease